MGKLNGEAKIIFDAISELKGDIKVINTDLKWVKEAQKDQCASIEEIKEKLNSGEGKIGKANTSIKYLFSAIGVITTVLLYILFK